MPELREVFEMTTKLMEPDVDAWREQEERQRNVRRNERVATFAVVGAIVVLIAVGWVVGTRGAHHEGPAKQPTVAPHGLISGAHSFDLRTGAETPLPARLAGGFAYVASPDGTEVVYGAAEGGGCSSGVTTIANIDGTSVRTLRQPEGSIVCGARWSPDGTELVYQLRKTDEQSVGNLFVEDVSSGRRTQITHLDLARAWWWYLSPSFSADGRNVVFQLPRSPRQNTTWDVWSVPTAGGDPRVVVRGAYFPMSFPDGSGYAFASPTTERGGPLGDDLVGRDISIVAADGSRRTLVRAVSGIWWPTMSPDGTRIAYEDAGRIFVVDVATGRSSDVAQGNTAEWLNDHTLLVAP
jgi:hypothetical protein